MKKNESKQIALVAGIIVTGLVGFIVFQGAFRHSIDTAPDRENAMLPQLVGGAEEEPYDSANEAAKLRGWTEDEAAAQQRLLEKQMMSKSANLTGLATGVYADGGLQGHWVCRGPHNMPGAWSFCEMDEGTDTVYAVTCGHYGGVQFIWKGTIWGDRWNCISKRYPTRYRDLIVVPNGTGRRIIAGLENGRVTYSDNSGATWAFSSGFSGGLKSLIVNRQDNFALYATDGAKVYKSNNKGTTFSVIQTINSTKTNACLYSPRWANKQPFASTVYLGINGAFYRLRPGETFFSKIGAMPWTGGPVSFGGDARKLWAVLDQCKWHYTTDVGASWTYVNIPSKYYTDPPGSNMYAGAFPGVNPENPDIIVGGFTVPGITQNAGASVNYSASVFWSIYQSSVDNDGRLRINYHPDFQASQFFYDKNGKLLTLRSSDGGVFCSYNEWTYTAFTSMAGIYYNITLVGVPSQEAYRGGFIYGRNNLFDMTVGAQDQGLQNTRLSSYGASMLSWNQVQGGDGPCCVTGDGIIGWRYNYTGTKEIKRIELYSNVVYKGLSGPAVGPKNFSFTGGTYFTPAVGDWSDGDRIWILSRTLRTIEYSNGTISGSEKDFSGNGSFIQGLAQSHSNANVLYVMQNGSVWKSTDRGNSWTRIATNAATGISASGEVHGMGWSSPLDQNIVLFATQSATAVKSVFSKDGGFTWKNVTGILPGGEVNGMAGTSDGKYVFASTSNGPYVFSVTTKLWYQLATDPDVPIFWGQLCYCVTFGSTQVARFSTWGQGIWDFVIKAGTSSSASYAEAIEPNGRSGISTSKTFTVRQTSTHLQITPPTHVNSYSYVILNLSGRTLYRSESRGQTMLDCSRLKIGSGQYLLRIMGGGLTIEQTITVEP